MKKNGMNSKSMASESETGLKHLKLVGVGREYIKERLDKMKKNSPEQFGAASKTNKKAREKV